MLKSVISKLMAFTLAISFMISVSIITAVYLKQQEDINHTLEEKIKTLSSLLSQVLINPVYNLKVNQVTYYLDLVSENEDVVSAWALDINGLIISDGTEENLLEDTAPESLQGVIKRVKKSRQFEVSQSADFYWITSPILTFNQDLIGFVYLKVSLEQSNAKVRSDFKSMLLLIVLLFCLGVLIAYISAKKLIQPIEGIRHATHLIAKGDFSVSLPEKGRDELSQLSKDINEMSRHLQSTTVSKNYVDNIINSMGDCLFVANESELIVTVNSALLKLLGKTEEEVLNQHVSTLFEYCSNNSLKQIHDSDNLKFITAEGEAIPVHLSLSSLTTIDHNNDWIVGVAQDIRDKIKVDQALKEAVSAAESAAVAKSQFLATMSHEIRTPMNGMIGMAQLLEDTPLNDEQKSYLATINQSGNNLLDIINDILDFSKLDADMTQMESIAFDLENVCQSCMELVANGSDKLLDIILDYDPDCPRHFIGDPAKIRQILINLLGNAIKFTEQGFIRCGVKCVFPQYRGPVELCIEVEDSGIGIKSEAIKKLFDEFTQADTTTTRKYGGTGLGLAITQKLVKLMGGEINISSNWGEGTTFFVNISLPQAAPPKVPAKDSLDQVNILFVDDSVDKCRIYQRLFEHMGADATSISDPTQVLDVMYTAARENYPYDIVVVDHIMPCKNGLTVGIDIRKQQQFDSTKLMIFSSVGQKGDAELFHRSGFNAYLSQVSCYETLRGMLLAMLNHSLSDAIITQHSIKEAQLHDKEVHTFNADILLVEDIVPNQIIAKKLLGKLGLTVDLAKDGQEAVDAFLNKKYDLIFMDCRMPVMDGYQATRKIREIEKQQFREVTTIVALTANASLDDQILCEEAGMNEVVIKPFKLADISNCLERWLTVEEDLAEVDYEHEVIAEQAESIDRAIYLEFCEDMEDEADTIIEAIIVSITEHLDVLKNHQGDVQDEEVIRHIHSIKSPAGSIGAMNLLSMAADLESELRKGNDGALEQSLEHLESEFNKVKEFLKKDR